MTQTLITRYQPGGDIYAKLVSQYGTGGADQVAAAALTGDRLLVTNAIAQAEYGAKLTDSTLAIFGNQIATDPLAAPLASAEKISANTFMALFKSPAVIVVLVIVGFSLMGGWQWLGRTLFAKK